MGLAANMLSAGYDVVTGHLGRSFTVSGKSGSFIGIFAPQTIAEELTIGGMRGKASATLTFSSSASYAPRSGDRITIAGGRWVVASTVNGETTWELGLISEDE